MKKAKPTGVGDILANLLENSELGLQLEKARIWQQWPEVAGPYLAAHGRPHAIRDNTLIVAVESPVWMHRYAYRKWDLLKRICRRAGHEIVSDIFIILEEDAEPTPPINGIEEAREKSDTIHEGKRGKGEKGKRGNGKKATRKRSTP